MKALNKSSVKFDGHDRTKLKITNKITKVILYPGYTEITNNNDICILRLKDQVWGSPTVKFIRLAEHEPAVGDMVKLTGWGRTVGKGLNSIQLKYVEMRIIPRNKFHAHMQSLNSSKTPVFPVTTTMICAQAKNATACHVR